MLMRKANMKEGKYKVYLSICEPYESLKNNSNYYIKLVNKGIWNEEIKGNYIGEVFINPNSKNNLKFNFENIEYLKMIVSLVVITIILIIILIIIIKYQKKHNK